LRSNTDNRTKTVPWNTPLWPHCWPPCGTPPTQAARLLRETPCFEFCRELRIAELRAEHQRAHAAGRYVETIRLVQLLNAARGLTPKRSIDFRDAVQRDHNEEREHGWSTGRR
jgi:hypothetical protein